MGAWAINAAIDRGFLTHEFCNIYLISLAFIAYLAANQIGGNGFIAAFVAGVATGNTLKHVIAILVRWLHETMDRLEQGLTPVILDAHFVLLGWTSSTPGILEEILIAQDRVERFLRKRGARRLYVALLAERADTTLMQELRLQLGEHWNARQIIWRNGSPLRLVDLELVDFAHACAIIVPAADSAASAMDADMYTVKILRTIGAALETQPPQESPLVVAEIRDTRYISALHTFYQGPMEIIAGDELISRLMAQNVRHPGLSHVYAELLSDLSGSQVYVREHPQIEGVSVQQLAYAFPEGVMLGVVRPRGDRFEALLNPPNDLRLRAEDSIAVLAPSYKDAAPQKTIGATVELLERPAPQCDLLRRRRVLVLGWNHRVPALLREFASYDAEQFAIDIVSRESAPKRETRIAVEALATARVEVRQLEFDFTVPAHLASLDLASYDNIVLLASEQGQPGAKSDARTILGDLLIRELIGTRAEAPSVLVELTDPTNVALFENRPSETIVSPVIISHILARVALRRQMLALFKALFSSGGCEIFFLRILVYGLAGGEYSFAELQRVADAHGEIAIGIRRAGQERTSNGGVHLNPRRDDRLQLSADDELIVLTTYMRGHEV